LKHVIREEDGEREIIPESPRFPELKTLYISPCLYVSKPSEPGRDALTTVGIIKFPRLRKLSLSNCSFFGPNNFAAQLPSLQILKIDGHKELRNLFAQLQVRPLYFSNIFFPF
jgi:hypothetical protein